MSEYRIERDSMGEVRVPADSYRGAQTQRSLQNFDIGTETMPEELIAAFAVLKQGCAAANFALGVISAEKCEAIKGVCGEILSGALNGEFPLKVWQTGSGTQTNMNLNEVIAGRANALAGKRLLHPNDDVNRSQSSNDTFPSAMRIAAVEAISGKLLPACDGLAGILRGLEAENRDVIKVGRTHLQDAVPIRFSQEISAWAVMVERSREMLKLSLSGLLELPLGGTAVGTGLNAPKGFDTAVAAEIARLTGRPFVTAPNKFHGLTSLDAFVFAHGALNALASDLMKIANDVRLLSSGPRCGIGEISIPANEPGSSIMPGKVNPTQCEAVTMVAAQVAGNNVTVGFAASQGNYQLNVFLPVCAYNFLQSARLLADVCVSFGKNCLSGLLPNRPVMERNLSRSLMNVTALNPLIGYDAAAKVAKYAHERDVTLPEAAAALGLLTVEEAQAALDPVKLV